MSLTPYYGLNYFGGNQPGDITEDGAKFTGRDRLAIDRMLHALATGSRHRRTQGILSAPAAPEVSIGVGGGLPGGASYTYCVSFVDADGLESMPSGEVTVNTPEILTEPGEPGVEDTTGALPAGLYYYALTALRGPEESPTGPQTSITLFEDGGVLLTLPEPPTGAENFQVWRMNATDPGWTRVEVVAAIEDSTFTDDGTVPANHNVDDFGQQPPATNSGIAIYSVTVALTSYDAGIVTGGGVAAWRIYRTESASAYPEDALVRHVIDRDDPTDSGNPALPLLTSWVDDGDILTSGVPPLSSTQMQVAPYVLDHAETLPNAADYPRFYPLVFAGQLYTNIDYAWVLLSGGSGTTQSFVTSTKFGVD